MLRVIGHSIANIPFVIGFKIEAYISKHDKVKP